MKGFAYSRSRIAGRARQSSARRSTPEPGAQRTDAPYRCERGFTFALVLFVIAAHLAAIMPMRAQDSPGSHANAPKTARFITKGNQLSPREQAAITERAMGNLVSQESAGKATTHDK